MKQSLYFCIQQQTNLFLVSRTNSYTIKRSESVDQGGETQKEEKLSYTL